MIDNGRIYTVVGHKRLFGVCVTRQNRPCGFLVFVSPDKTVPAVF